MAEGEITTQNSVDLSVEKMVNKIKNKCRIQTINLSAENGGWCLRPLQVFLVFCTKKVTVFLPSREKFFWVGPQKFSARLVWGF